MSITLSDRFLRELDRGVNTPNVVIEIELDGGAVRFGYHGRNALPVQRFLADGRCLAGGDAYAVGSDELPGVVSALKSVSSLQNRLDPKSGYSTRGQLTAVIAGRENFRSMLSTEYLRNRRAVRRDGFLANGYCYPDYATTYSGKITDWSRKGDELTIVIADDLKDASIKIPEESSDRTGYIDYRGMNPVDIMADMLINQVGIDEGQVDLDSFVRERDTWLPGWRFERVLTEPKEANHYLNELQTETNSFILHDGEKVSFKVFAPPEPSQEVQEWTDSEILGQTLAVKGGYKDHFFNRVIVYFDHDESGSDKEDNFESVVIAVDAASQDSSQWDEASSKVVRSRWMRSLGFEQDSGISGVLVYHVSRANGPGSGTLRYDSASLSMTWEAPGGLPGEAVTLSQDGKYQIFDADSNRYARVMVRCSELPAGDADCKVELSEGSGPTQAAALACKLLNRYRDPVATASFEIDINCMASGGRFIKPTDLKDITTDEAGGLGKDGWVRNRLMLTSVRPDFGKGVVAVEAMETRMHRRYGFISPAGAADYTDATEAHRRYGFIGGSGNSVGTGAEDGHYIW